MSILHITEGCTFPPAAYDHIDDLAEKLVSALFKKESLSHLSKSRKDFYSFGVGNGYYGNHNLSINGNIFATIGCDDVVHTQEPVNETPLHIAIFELLSKEREVFVKPQSHICA